MTRLIDADALLEAFKEKSNTIYNKEWRLFDIEDLITNAPTVHREGWVSVENLQRLYDDMFRHKDISISANSLFKLINHE